MKLKSLLPLQSKAGSSAKKRWVVLRTVIFGCGFCLILLLNMRNFDVSRNYIRFLRESRNKAFIEVKDKEWQRHETSSSSGGPKLCPAVFEFYKDEEKRQRMLRMLFEQATTYHNFGGNLKAIEEFLNNQVDYTFQQHGMTFRFGKSQDDMTDNIHKAIIDELKKRDAEGPKRGGYGQTHLPGSFPAESIPKYANVRQNKGRMINVIEPIDDMRWNLAIGPCLNEQCHGFKTIHGSSKVYEDKYMCAFDKVANNLNHTTAVKSQENRSSKSDVTCNILSIGSNDEWGFETVILKETQCKVHTFDCTLTDGTPRKIPKDPSVSFYNACIGMDDSVVNGRKYLSYPSLLEEAGLKHSPRYLKMDVEGFEFDVLTSMIKSAKQTNTINLLPEQLQIEFHYATKMLGLPWTMRFRQTAELALLFSMLFREAGYVVVHKISHAATITELLLLRIYC